MRTLLVLLFITITTIGFAQQPFTIDLVIEGSEESNSTFKDLVKEEIEALLSSRTPLTFNEIYTGFNRAETLEKIDEAVASNSDLVITLGIMPSSELAMHSQFAKPSIAGIVMSEQLFHLKATEEGTSGINNFTYIMSPFDVSSDLEMFRKITDFKHLGLVIDQGFLNETNLVEQFFGGVLPADEFEMVPLTGDPAADAASIPDNIDAIYVLPMGNYSKEDIEKFFFDVGERGIPSFAMMGKNYTNAGALASQAPDNFFSTYARRIALDALKIYEGKNPSELPVYINGLQKDFVINMKTANHIGLTPNFDVLNQATLLGLGETASNNELTLETVIYEALSKNLSYQVAEENNAIADEDVNLAKANLFPQISANTAVGLADNNIQGFLNEDLGSFTYGADLTQLIYSEPVYANIAIQKLLKQQTEAATEQTKLDIVLSASQAYLQYLQAQKILQIRSENVSVTKQNLDISSSKADLGYSGLSDVYRLESQLAQNNIDLNTAFATLEQAKINLNQLLNRPQGESFAVADVSLNSDYSLFLNEELGDAVNNQSDIDALVAFFLDIAREELPELQQLQFAKQAQERSLLSNQRSLFLPQVALSANYGNTIDYFSLPAGFPSETSPTYTIGGQISLPIFQGGTRKANIRRTQHSLNQIELQTNDTNNLLEQALRSNFENLGVSYQSVALTSQAADAARKNFEIVQDLYQNGEVDIITLIDAQNASLSAELNANNIIYQLMIDVLTVERYTGQYYFLMDEAEQAEYLNEIKTYLINR